MSREAGTDQTTGAVPPLTAQSLARAPPGLPLWKDEWGLFVGIITPLGHWPSTPFCGFERPDLTRSGKSFSRKKPT